MYKVIKSSSTILKQVVGEIIWSECVKVLFFKFAALAVLRRFYVDVAFIIVIVKWE
jgi:hypothetical protein